MKYVYYRTRKYSNRNFYFNKNKQRLRDLWGDESDRTFATLESQT